MAQLGRKTHAVTEDEEAQFVRTERAGPMVGGQPDQIRVTSGEVVTTLTADPYRNLWSPRVNDFPEFESRLARADPASRYVPNRQTAQGWGPVIEDRVASKAGIEYVLVVLPHEGSRSREQD